MSGLLIPALEPVKRFWAMGMEFSKYHLYEANHLRWLEEGTLGRYIARLNGLDVKELLKVLVQLR